MYARLVEEHEARLGELRRSTWEGVILGCLAFTAALGASALQPALALPLFFGGVTGIFLGIRAEWHRWDLVDRLVTDPDAYGIPEVRARALDEVTPERRRSLACSLRLLVNAPGGRIVDRITDAADDLEALARELDDDALALDPAAAVACARLFSDPTSSPLFDESASAADVRSRVRHIRSGFDHRHLPA
jgi:hypothetical protein